MLQPKDIDWLKGYKNKTCIYAVYKRPTSDLGTHTDWKWGDGKRYYTQMEIKRKLGGFPGGAVVESLPANAGDTGSGPDLRRSHMPRSSWAREPQLLSLRVWSLCSATGEAAIVKRPAHRDDEWPPLAATAESPRTETKTQHSQK